MCYVMDLIPPGEDWHSLKLDFTFRGFVLTPQKVLEEGNRGNNISVPRHFLFCVCNK